MVIQGNQLIIFEWCMVGLALGFVCFRLYVRIPSRSSRRPSTSTISSNLKPSVSAGSSGQAVDPESGSITATCSRWWCPWPLSDIFVVLAWCSFVGQAAMDTLLNMDGFFTPGVDPWNPAVPDDKAERALKLFFLENVTYLSCMFFVKFSMLALFHSWFSKDLKKIRICLWITDVFTVISYLAGTLIITLYCLPVQRNWTRNPNQYCSTYNSTVVVIVAMGSHILTDIMIYLLPMAVVWTIRHSLPRWQRVGIIYTFGAGFICMFFAVGLLVCYYIVTSFAVYWTFCVFEQLWAIIVACLPAIKYLISSSRWRWIRRVRDEVECAHGYRATHMDLLHETDRQHRGSVFTKRANSVAQSSIHDNTDPELAEPLRAALAAERGVSFSHNSAKEC